MDPRIQQLVDKLPRLDENEKKLRLESNTLAYPVMTEHGKVEMEIADPGRLKEIRIELEQITQERRAIQDKLIRLQEILGDGLQIPNPDRHDDYAARLRSEFLMKFENKICKSHRQPLTPEEGIASPEYATLKGEYMPRLDEIAAMQERDGKLAEAAYQILSGP